MAGHWVGAIPEGRWAICGIRKAARTAASAGTPHGEGCSAPCSGTALRRKEGSQRSQ